MPDILQLPTDILMNVNTYTNPKVFIMAHYLRAGSSITHGLWCDLLLVANGLPWTSSSVLWLALVLAPLRYQLPTCFWNSAGCQWGSSLEREHAQTKLTLSFSQGAEDCLNGYSPHNIHFSQWTFNVSEILWWECLMVRSEMRYIHMKGHSMQHWRYFLQWGMKGSPSSCSCFSEVDALQVSQGHHKTTCTGAAL